MALGVDRDRRGRRQMPVHRGGIHPGEGGARPDDGGGGGGGSPLWLGKQQGLWQRQASRGVAGTWPDAAASQELCAGRAVEFAVERIRGWRWRVLWLKKRLCALF